MFLVRIVAEVLVEGWLDDGHYLISDTAPRRGAFYTGPRGVFRCRRRCDANRTSSSPATLSWLRAGALVTYRARFKHRETEALAGDAVDAVRAAAEFAGGHLHAEAQTKAARRSDGPRHRSSHQASGAIVIHRTDVERVYLRHARLTDLAGNLVLSPSAVFGRAGRPKRCMQHLTTDIYPSASHCSEGFFL